MTNLFLGVHGSVGKKHTHHILLEECQQKGQWYYVEVEVQAQHDVDLKGKITESLEMLDKRTK